MLLGNILIAFSFIVLNKCSLLKPIQKMSEAEWPEIALTLSNTFILTRFKDFAYIIMLIKHTHRHTHSKAWNMEETFVSCSHFFFSSFLVMFCVRN